MIDFQSVFIVNSLPDALVDMNECLFILGTLALALEFNFFFN